MAGYRMKVSTLRKVVEDMERRGIGEFYPVRDKGEGGGFATIYGDGTPWLRLRASGVEYSLVVDLDGDGDRSYVRTEEPL